MEQGLIYGAIIFTAGYLMGFVMGKPIKEYPEDHDISDEIASAKPDVVSGRAEFIMPDRVKEITKNKPNATLDDVIVKS